MSNVFNLRRFTQLFINHTVANYRMYLMSFGVLMGILFLVMIYASSIAKSALPVGAREMFFSIFMFVGAAIFTTGIFSSLGDKRKAIAYLMLPASNLEKLLVAWLYSFFIFLVLYLAGFYIIDLVVLSIGKSGATKPVTLFFHRDFHYRTPFLSFAWVHSMAFFGALFFKKMHFIKTAFTVFILIMAIVILNDLSINLMIGPSVETGQPFGSLMIYEGDKTYYLKGSEMVVLVPYLTVGLSLLLWTGAFFKLKETEV